MKINRRQFFAITGASLLSPGCDPTKPLRVSGTLAKKCGGHKGMLTTVAVTPDGKMAVSGGGEATIRVWSLPDCKEVRTIPITDKPHRGDAVFQVQISPDGKLLATLAVVANRFRLRLWELATGKEVQHQIGVDCGFGLAFSSDGTKLAIAGEGVQVWDFRRSRKLHNFQFGRTPGSARRVAFSPDGTRLAAAMQYGGSPKVGMHPVSNVRAWDLGNGKETFASPEWEPYKANAVVFSPDGELLVAGGRVANGGGRIYLWDVSSNKLVHKLEADSYDIYCLARSPDGKVLASGGNDEAIKFWDAKRGKLVGQVEGHTEPVKDICFYDDGQSMVSVGLDKVLLVWQIDLR